MQRRTFAAATPLVLLAPAAALVRAQGAASSAWPDKPVRVVIPFPPGGGIDVFVRALTAELAPRWKQPIVVDNRPGAGSLIGAAEVAKAPADGTTLLATVNQTLVANRFLYKSPPYDPDRSFEPIVLMTRSDQLVLANASFAAGSLKELVALARKEPGKLAYGSYGVGSQPHLVFETLKAREKIDLLHVPYKGIAPMLTALAAGEVAVGIGSAAVAAPLVAAGKIKAISVAGAERVAAHPGVPTAAEEGYPFVQASIWFALFAPAGTPAAAVEKIRADVRALLADPAFVERQVTSKGFVVVAGDGARLRQAVRDETAIAAEQIKAAGIAPE